VRASEQARLDRVAALQPESDKALQEAGFFRCSDERHSGKLDAEYLGEMMGSLEHIDALRTIAEQDIERATRAHTATPDWIAARWAQFERDAEPWRRRSARAQIALHRAGWCHASADTFMTEHELAARCRAGWVVWTAAKAETRT